MLTTGFWSLAPVISKAVPSVYFRFFCLLVSSVSNFHPDTRWGVVVTFFRLTCSVVLWGGRNSANKYHWRVLTVIQPHWVCPDSWHVCFTSLHCSGSRLLCRELSDAGPGLHALPRSSHSGSGSWVLHKGADLVGSAFCACPRSEQLRWPGAWRAESPASPVPAAWFSGCTLGAPSQVYCVSLLGSWSLAATLPVDVDHPESQKVLVSSEVCLQFALGCLSGAAIAPFRLWLLSPACLWWGMGLSTAG